MISRNIKIKIDDETTKIINHDVDLIKIFGEETLESTENERVS